MKLAVIYDSKTGNTRQAAEWIAEGMRQIQGVDACSFGLQGSKMGHCNRKYSPAKPISHKRFLNQFLGM